jgi:GGDEF domain-containing protein
MHVSVSIGVATFPRDGRTTEEILLAADRACFVAKRTGPGLIATADEGLAIARDFAFKAPTPIDEAGPSDDVPAGHRRNSAAAEPAAGAEHEVAARPSSARRKPVRPVDASPVS